MQRRGDTSEIEGDEWDRVIAVYLCGVWSCVEHELRQMLRNGGGVIVNCSSLGGVVGNPGLNAYHVASGCAAPEPATSLVTRFSLRGGYTAQ